jgi:hypothetical protein
MYRKRSGRLGILSEGEPVAIISVVLNTTLSIMLIPFTQIKHILDIHGIELTGALHIGAHDCEEIPFYQDLGLSLDRVVWIDAIPSKVDQAKARGIPNVYTAVITDKDDEDVIFNVSNNVQSSSVLAFGTHATEHPWVEYIDTLHLKSVTIPTFFQRNTIDPKRYDFWNFDIQGAELMALKGASDYIHYAKAMYLEVNEKELYKGCGLIEEIDAFLEPYHFKRSITHMTHHGWGDALYIRTDTVC